MVGDPETSAAQRAVRDVLARMSAAWQSRRYDELGACFDERIVMAAPGFRGKIEGRAVCVESFREFMERVTVSRYKEEPPAVEVWGDTAVATYRWEMAWDVKGTPNHEAGHDVLVLRQTGPGTASVWRVVWRTMTRDAAP